MLTRARLREKVKPFARRLRGIAQISRLSILYLLSHGPMIVRDIGEDLAMPQPLVAHHLKQMYRSGWIVRTKRGREVVYQLKEKSFFEFFRLFEDTPFEKEVLSKYFR